MKKHLVKLPTGRSLPLVQTVNLALLDKLLTETSFRQVDGTKVVIRTARENVERYRHLWEET